MDKETKEYIDSEIIKLIKETDPILAQLRRDLTDVKKRLRKLEN